MGGEKNLQLLLQTIQPVLNKGDYVFCTTNNIEEFDLATALMTFKEHEGTAIIIQKEIADKFQLSYSFIAAWITLTVHSSLEAVGLTAAFSKALATENISCNVVAGYYHDHIFVRKEDAQKAMKVLESLQG